MKLALILLTVLQLTGCATGCREACVFGFGPGNSAFDAIAEYHDTRDPCQRTGKEAGYRLPSFCRVQGQSVTITGNGQTRTYYISR